jgi:multiple sugar transport system substrate-binding protein
MNGLSSHRLGASVQALRSALALISKPVVSSRVAFFSGAVLFGGAIALGCGSSENDTAVASLTGVDDGTTITMWTRDDTVAQSGRLVDAYNASHANRVELTPILTANYADAIAMAAAGGTLPDVFSADVVFAPNYTSSGFLLDISDRIGSLPYKNSLVPAHIELGSYQGKNYAVPLAVSISVLFWNKALYARAGLDPEKGPSTLRQLGEQARAIRALGGDIYGTMLAGNCGGCGVFTLWPSVWAAGADVMNAEGTVATLDSAPVKAVLSIWRELYADGTAQPGSMDESGATWYGRFMSGNIGIAPMPATSLAAMEEAGIDVGLGPITGPTGGESTFVGGDVVGISAKTTRADAAWNFLAWTLSERAQVENLAKNKDLLARTDLADNEFSAADPRVLTDLRLLPKGKAPFALNFNQTFNNPAGPWLSTLRGALFGPDLDAALAAGNPKVTESLSQK